MASRESQESVPAQKQLLRCQNCQSQIFWTLAVVQSLSYVWLCNPINCSTPGFPVLHYLPEFAQTHVHCVGDATQPFHRLSPPYPLSSIFPSIGVFSVSWLFASGGQSIGASASASILPMNIQGWFPLGLTGLISLLSKGLWRVFSSTIIQKHQLFDIQPSLLYNSHIHTWLLEKP